MALPFEAQRMMLAHNIKIVKKLGLTFLRAPAFH